MEATKRAAIYLRMSEDRTGDELGVSRQRDDCIQLIERRGWTPAGEYCDNDVSAAGKVKRPEFLRLLAALDRGEIDVVVAWALPRLVRNARDRLALVEVCRRRRVIVSLVKGTEYDCTTSGGRMLIGILGEVAQNEIDEKSERQCRAAEQRAERGKPWLSRRPFGYEPDGMHLREPEAELIRWAYAELIKGGSVRGIATRWNEDGVLTSKGNMWRGAQVHELLRNARNAGIRTHTTKGPDDRRVTREVGPASWGAIVDEQTYRAAVGILTDPGRKIGRDRVRKYLGTGLYLCGVCDKPVGSHIATSNGKFGYRCKGFDGSGGHVSRNGARTDEVVEAMIVGRFAEPDAAELLLESGPDAAQLQQRAMTLRARLEAFTRECANDPDISPSEYKALTAPTKNQLREIEQQMTSASKVPILADLVKAGANAGALWFGDPDDQDDEGLSLERKRSVLDALLTVRIMPTGRTGRAFDRRSIEITWK
jgi:DNA invertase Pin-like site-specific DNA recombinase